MPVLERFFPAGEPGRRRRTGEEPMPFPMGSLPGYQQGTLAWDLPEMIKMVKLVWKSKGELRGAKHRGVLESEDALGGSAGRFPPPRCSGEPGGKAGRGPGPAGSRGRRAAAAGTGQSRWGPRGCRRRSGAGWRGAGPGSAARRASGLRNVLLAALALFPPRTHTRTLCGLGEPGAFALPRALSPRAIRCVLLHAGW